MTVATKILSPDTPRNDAVLISWIARDVDPFDGDSRAGGSPLPGPTLTILFDPTSPYRGRIRDVVFLVRRTRSYQSDKKALENTKLEIAKQAPEIAIHERDAGMEDPSDHRAIFEFVKSAIPELRQKFAGRELVIHSSPGTAAMQTIWVLMSETGFIPPPFSLVKSLRPNERNNRPAVMPVELEIETFYKVYRETLAARPSSDADTVDWDPGRFRTSRMRALFSEAQRFARVNVPLLLLGERGTGKTSLASWIRFHSPHRKKERDHRWPAVACGQYSAETMRAELFGYVKGAFTDAKQNKDGLLASADGDTLFLDEVGDVSRDVQRLLIKALEEKQYFALGDDTPRASDFRLLAATNVSPEELRARLDPDFLDRISLLTLELPPLREIREELPWLWGSVFARARRRALPDDDVGLEQSENQRVVAALAEHPLPGNLRDLFRVAYRVLAAFADEASGKDRPSAIEYGLAGLDDPLHASQAGAAVSRTIARAFSSGKSLEGALSAAGRIPTKQVLSDFKRYLAHELRRLAKNRDQRVEELCDMTGRSLQDWAEPEKKKSSAARKVSSKR